MAVSIFAAVARNLGKNEHAHGYGCPLAKLRKTPSSRAAPFGLVGFDTMLRLGSVIFFPRVAAYVCAYVR